MNSAIFQEYLYYVTAIKKVLESVNNSNMEKPASYRADNIL